MVVTDGVLVPELGAEALLRVRGGKSASSSNIRNWIFRAFSEGDCHDGEFGEVD